MQGMAPQDPTPIKALLENFETDGQTHNKHCFSLGSSQSHRLFLIIYF